MKNHGCRARQEQGVRLRETSVCFTLCTCRGTDTIMPAQIMITFGLGLGVDDHIIVVRQAVAQYARLIVFKIDNICNLEIIKIADVLRPAHSVCQRGVMPHIIMRDTSWPRESQELKT